MYNVFADFHHAGLLHSLIMLFEDRLGGKLYRPIGMDWATAGFWKVYDHPATQAQFLGIGGATPDGSEPLNEVESATVIMTQEFNPHNQTIRPPKSVAVYNCHDIDSGFTNKAITLAGFMDLRFDFVIASLPVHVEPFRKLCDMHPNRPKLIYQIGNAWNIEPGYEHLVDGIMASARVTVPDNFSKPVITYHQEFNLDLFKPTPPVNSKLVTSFINCYNVADHFRHDWALFEQTEQYLPTWVFKSLGGQCRDGCAHGAAEVADLMQSSRFIWHLKNFGDGYGHILHNSAAVGRPAIVKRSYYDGKLGADLLIDGTTCLNVDGLDAREIAIKIDYYNEPSRYAKLCQNVYTNFKQVVDFTNEAEALRSFLEGVTHGNL